MARVKVSFLVGLLIGSLLVTACIYRDLQHMRKRIQYQNIIDIVLVLAGSPSAPRPETTEVLRKLAVDIHEDPLLGELLVAFLDYRRGKFPDWANAAHTEILEPDSPEELSRKWVRIMDCIDRIHDSLEKN